MANTPELNFSFTLTTGDWSCDGHNISDVTLFKCNKSLSDVKKAHGMASKLYGIHLDSQCEDYEDSQLKQGFIKKCIAAFHNCPAVLKMECLQLDEDDEDSGYCDSGDFCRLYLEIAKLGDPDLEWKAARNNDANENIGGYGLFSN